MPIFPNTQTDFLTSGGGTLNYPILSNMEVYIIKTAAPITLTSNWTIQPQGVPAPTQRVIYDIRYEAKVTLASNTITVFGQTMPPELSDKTCDIRAYWDGVDWEVNFIPDVLEEGSIPASSVAVGDVAFKDIFTTHTTENGNPSPVVNIGFGSVNTYQPELRVRDLKGQDCLEIKGQLLVTGVDETAIIAGKALKIISCFPLPATNGPNRHVIFMESSTKELTPILTTSGHQHPFNTDDDIYIVIPASFLGTGLTETYTLYIDLKIPY